MAGNQGPPNQIEVLPAKIAGLDIGTNECILKMDFRLRMDPERHSRIEMVAGCGLKVAG